MVWDLAVDADVEVADLQAGLTGLCAGAPFQGTRLPLEETAP